MNFKQLTKTINKLNCESYEELKEFEKKLDITSEDFSELIKNTFSRKIKKLNVNKLPYVIDVLYQSNNKFNFMLGCMLLEATCSNLPFLTNLENHRLFTEKYEVLVKPLIRIFEAVNNGISNCMALIILNNDPKFTLLQTEEKQQLINATNIKLKDIINYLKNSSKIDNRVYEELEILIDLACFMGDTSINQRIEELELLPLTNSCRLFIAKYKLNNQKVISQEEIAKLIEDKENIYNVVSVFENSGGIEFLEKANIKQEEVAKSYMIDWLKYPTELGKAPEDIQLLGTLDIEDEVVYIYKFKSDTFKDKGYMIGISGGFPKNKITVSTSGRTFSKFETVEEDFIKQGKDLVEFISEYWKKAASEQL